MSRRSYSLWRALTCEAIRQIWEYYPKHRQNSLLKQIHDYCFPDWVEWSTERTMAHVDAQVEEIKAAQAAADDQALLAKAQAENPDAHVEVIHPFDGPDHKPGDASIAAVKIERPPDGSTAQDLLGGEIEIKAPWAP